ncbi:MAG: M3 family metallopeptidase [Deltaproteobacteria bacterium]|nr:M3 family metallopeptidase [Deltaproteobacteria bacterium]
MNADNDHRLDVPRWDLTDLYESAGDPGIFQDLETVRAQAVEFRTTYRGRFIHHRVDPLQLLSALKAYEAIHEQGMGPFFFAFLQHAAQTREPECLSLFQRIRETWKTISKDIRFFEHELMGLTAAGFEELLRHPDLSPYRWFLMRLIRQRPHRLSESEEEILDAHFSACRSSLTSFYDEFLGSLVFSIKIDHRLRRLHMEEVAQLRCSPDGAIRRRAVHGSLQELSKHGTVFKHILNAVVESHLQEKESRAYASVLQMNLVSDGLDEDVMETLMDRVESHYPLARTYWGLKARRLGADRLAHEDLLAPTGGAHANIPFSEGRDLILACSKEIHPTICDYARACFGAGRVDAQLRKGKRIGAFCESFAPSQPPYVAISYGGTIRDLMILSHEMGHVIHYCMAAGKSYLNFRPPPILAETAATFFEMLFCRYLMEQPAFADHQADILGTCVDDILVCIFRQHVLTRFEQSIYEVRGDHFLSEMEIGDLWWKKNRKLFGESVKMGREYRWGWTPIPHFIHHPFYCYSYIFGNMVSLWLFNRYQQDSREALDALFHLLRSGGAEAPLDLLSRLGIDPTKDAFYETAFECLNGLIHSLETLPS